MSYNNGDRVYIIANNVSVQELEVVSVQGEFYTLRNLSTYGGMRLRENRLFATRDEAERELADIRRRHDSDSMRSY